MFLFIKASEDMQADYDDYYDDDDPVDETCIIRDPGVLVHCLVCAHEISCNAHPCPHCGEPYAGRNATWEIERQQRAAAKELEERQRREAAEERERQRKKKADLKRWCQDYEKRVSPSGLWHTTIHLQVKADVLRQKLNQWEGVDKERATFPQFLSKLMPFSDTKATLKHIYSLSREGREDFERTLASLAEELDNLQEAAIQKQALAWYEKKSKSN